MFKYYGNKNKMVAAIRAAIPSQYNEYLELCAGIAAVARKVIDSNIPRTIVEKDHGQATLLKQVQQNPVEIALRLKELGYSRDVFDDALEMKKRNYEGCSKIETAVYRKILTDQSYNASCSCYRDIDKGCDDSIDLLISANRSRERYLRQILPDCCTFSEEMQGIEIIEGDMFDYLGKLDDSNLFCTIDPPYEPSKRSAGQKGYDQDWSDGMHLRLMEALYKQYLHKKLNAKVMIFCYVNLEDLQSDIYCRYLMRMGFTLYLLKDVYLPQIYSKKIKDKIDNLEKTRKKKKVVECIFINYEPIAKGIVVPERVIKYEDVFG